MPYYGCYKQRTYADQCSMWRSIGVWWRGHRLRLRGWGAVANMAGTIALRMTKE